ncbi:hypothetical protein EZV62_016136 [Acer yangbiense]|uniref:60S acidic ribosomal protein P2 n=1 Tax=Acer yangbiense TaxID=1000413 RepID=A0A5C7HMM6_9ROSI|nr:hypothetical protein EZV62_016136 [Acer yangbiense]
MKVAAAYLLAVLGGNTSPSATDIKGIFGSVGSECEDDRIELLLSQVSGKDITELIASGRGKLASVPSGGGVAVAMAASGGGAAAAPAAAESKKEEKVEEKEESDDTIAYSIWNPQIEFFLAAQVLCGPLELKMAEPCDDGLQLKI